MNTNVISLAKARKREVKSADLSPRHAEYATALGYGFVASVVIGHHADEDHLAAALLDRGFGDQVAWLSWFEIVHT